MGYLSCNAESAIATCDSYNFPILPPSKTPPNTRPSDILHFSFSDLHAATDGFSSANLLGKGSHGSVYKGHLRHLKLLAAVKKTKQPHAADNEAEILSTIYHPRLVNLHGFALDLNHQKVIVVEYMPNGSLFDMLHGSGQPPGWVRRTRFALQVAWALHFLHSSHPPIIHRDVKSSNVLIDSDFNSRISDFGLALRDHVEDVKVKSTPPAGTLGYLDPGYLAPGDLSTKSDVFSFGILVMEIISGRNAIDVRYSPPSVVEWALPEIRSGNFDGICDPRIGPPEDSEALRRMAVLAAQCVRSKAERRPGMAEVVDCLKSVYKRMKMRSQVCMRFGGCVASDVAKYEPLDDSVEVARKVSSATRVKKGSDVIGDCVGSSKSIGTVSEIKFLPTDLSNENINRRRAGLSVKRSTVKLSKSRSMGRLEESKLLVANVNGQDREY